MCDYPGYYGSYGPCGPPCFPCGPPCFPCGGGGSNIFVGKRGPTGPTGATGATGSDADASKWSEFPATQNVDLDCNLINKVEGINYCDGTYIGVGPTGTFEFTSSGTLFISGTAGPTGPSIVTTDRIYQELNPTDNSCNSVNGYLGLAKDAYPAVGEAYSDKSVSTWKNRVAAANNLWRGVCWSPELNLFAAVSNTGSNNRIMTSPDGINWTSQVSPANNNWRSICWSRELGLFVATSINGANRVMTSPDGINWTLQQTGVDMLSCNNGIGNSITCVDTTGLEVGMFITVKSGTGTVPANTVVQSIDGPTSFTTNNTITGLNNTTLNADNQWLFICWSPQLGLLVSVAYLGSSSRVMTSPDSITWTLRTAPENQWYSVCWSPELSLFAAVADTGVGDRVMTSPDGITWTSQTSPEDNQWLSICWSPELGIFVAVAGTGVNRIMTSPDGINWTARQAPVDNVWRTVCWSPQLSLFVAGAIDIATVGQIIPDRVMTSCNGINWTIRQTGIDLLNCNNGIGNSVICDSTVGLTVGMVITIRSGPGTVPVNTTIQTITGPTSFTTNNTITGLNNTTLNADNQWNSICWSPELGIFVVVGASGGVTTSSLQGRPPTSYNVFDSNFNRIDENGNWTIQQVLKQGVYTDGATTPSVAGTAYLSITNAGPTTITNFTNGSTGQQLLLVFNDANTTIQSSASIRLAGGVNFVSTQYDTLTLVHTGSQWVEVCRSVNA